MIQQIAEKLATSRYRFLTDVQIGTLRRQFDATRDEIRTAAIIADRIRRQRQADELGNGFRVEPQISPDAPIELKPERRLTRRERLASGAL